MVTQLKEAIEKVQADAQRQKGRKPVIWQTEWPKVGYVVRQGDVAIRREKERAVPQDAVLHAEYQLAPGNTRGSRHIARNVYVVQKQGGNDVLLGPVFVAGKESVVDHPTHDGYTLVEGQCYSVHFQQDLAKSQRERVQD